MNKIELNNIRKNIAKCMKHLGFPVYQLEREVELLFLRPVEIAMHMGIPYNPEIEKFLALYVAKDHTIIVNTALVSDDTPLHVISEIYCHELVHSLQDDKLFCHYREFIGPWSLEILEDTFGLNFNHEKEAYMLGWLFNMIGDFHFEENLKVILDERGETFFEFYEREWREVVKPAIRKALRIA